MQWKRRTFTAERDLFCNNGLSAVTACLLANAGIKTMDEANEFLGDGTIHDPIKIPNLHNAIQLIMSFVKNGSLIYIFGDYDCDGVTASAVLYLALKRIGANVRVRLPDRITEGYGMSLKAVDEMAQNGAELIITVDNGIRAIKEIERAAALGIQTVVLDHHVPGNETPKAAAVVDLWLEKGDYPFTHLTGAGLAWKAACLLLQAYNETEYAMSLVDLAAIGTVADVEILQGENRAIVKRAIALMKKQDYRRAGVRWLMNNNLQHVTAEDIAFRIGPCINACGRLLEKGAEMPLNLLLETNQIYAVQKANAIIEVNEKRKQIQAKCYAEIKAEAEKRIQKGDKVLVLFSKDAPSGIVGLLAGNLKEEYHRPAIVFSKKKDSSGNTVWTGSARSIEAFNMVEALEHVAGENDSVFLAYGGHAMAAGMSIRAETRALNILRTSINFYANGILSPEDLEPTLYYDMNLDAQRPNDIVKLAVELEELEPYGVGCPRLIFCIDNFVPQSRGSDLFQSLGQTDKHLKLMADGFSVLGFNMLDRYQQDGTPRKISIVGTLSINYFKGGQYVQFSLLDYHIPEQKKVTPLASALADALKGI